MLESSFVQLLIDNSEFIENTLSNRSVSALRDFISGYSAFRATTEPLLEGFQLWLGIELSCMHPSKLRGGVWIGDSINWPSMLLRHYKSEQDAFDGFFAQLRRYQSLPRSTIHCVELDGERQSTFLIKDYGGGLPKQLEIYSIGGHQGVYVRALYESGCVRLIGYFSYVQEVDDHVLKTRALGAR